MANTNAPVRDLKPSSIGQFGSEMKARIQETGEAAAEKAKDVASTMTEKAKETVEKAKETASSMAKTAGQKAEDATSAVGTGMKNLAGNIRENLPHEGFVGSASSAVADTLESSGRYLQEEGLSGISHDLTNLIRRNPIPAVLIGIGLGFLLARSTRS